MKSRLFLFLFSFMLLCSFVSAVPPFQSSSNIVNELSIIYPSYDFVKIGEDISLHFHVFNSTGYMVTDANCSIHLSSNNNSDILNGSLINNGVAGYVFNINSSINNRLGVISYTVWCENSQAGFLEGYLTVTKSGEFTNINNLVIVLSIVGVVFVLLVLSFNLDNKHFLLKLLLILFSLHLLLLLPKLSINVDDVVGFSFYKTYLGFLKVFWFYIISYFVYEVLDYFGKLDGIKKKLSGLKK